MDKDRQAVESIRRNERIKSATTADEKRLAEVESAVIASKQKLIDDEAQMRASGKYADGYITTQLAVSSPSTFIEIRHLSVRY